MKTRNKIFNLLVMLSMLSFTACSSGGDGDEPGGGNNSGFSGSDFGEVDKNSSFVSDFNMSDIDLLVDFAINCDLLDLEWIKYMSNGFKGELMSGPGEYSDATDYFQIEYDILANSEAYLNAMERLANDGICDNTTTTTRGLKDAAKETGLWVLDIFTNVKKDNENLKATLRDMGAFGNKQMQEDVYNSTDSHGGYKDAHSFFVALNNGELVMASPQIMSDLDDRLGSVMTPGSHTYEAWEKSKEKLGIKDKYNRFVDRGKDLGNKAIKVEEAMVDVVTGGGYSTAQKADEWAKNTEETVKKVFNGKLDKITTEDVKEVAKKYTVDYLKGKMPKTGNDNIDNALKFATDKLGEVALKKDPTGDAAKDKGKTILNIKNNTGENLKAIIVTGDDGKLSVVIPDKDGNGTSVTDPGNKKITAVSKDGKRSTKATTAKKDGGKQEEKIDPEPTGDPKITASVSKVPFTANPKDNEKTATFTVTTNCKYFGVKAKDDPKWLTLKKDTKAGTVTVTVTPNSDQEPREAKIIIAGSNDKKTTVIQTEVLVTQEAPKPGKLSVSSDLIEFDYEGGSNFTVITCEGYEKMAVSVPSDCKDWLSASIKSTAAGNEIVSITAKANTSYKRTGIITLMAGNADKLTKDNSEAVEITVEQAGAPIEKTVFSVEDWVLEFDSKGGSKSTKVTTNADEVTATCNADWITVDVSKSSIKITVNENKSTEKRSAVISVTAKRAVKTSETSGYTEETTETIDIYQDGTDAFGNEILWGTWSYNNISLKLRSGGSFSYKSGSYSDSGSYKVTDFKCTAIAGTNGYYISGTLYGIKGEYWTFKTTYSKDGSGYYMKRHYCLTLTSKSSGSSIIVYKE
jgi:hypothetical protein